jgi:hypothetical protein
MRALVSIAFLALGAGLFWVWWHHSGLPVGYVSKGSPEVASHWIELAGAIASSLAGFIDLYFSVIKARAAQEEVRLRPGSPPR